MSDSSRPHGLQPTRLLHPWDFPGKSTGAIGSEQLLLNLLTFLASTLFLPFWISFSVSHCILSFLIYIYIYPFIHGIFPGKNTGVGCHFLLQGIFPTQGLNLGLPHCNQTLYHLSHQGCFFILYIYIYMYMHTHICIHTHTHIYIFDCKRLLSSCGTLTQ